MRPLALLFIIPLLTSCQNGKYVGPSIGVAGGYEGASLGITLYGENPVSAQAATTTSVGVVQVSTGTK